MFSSRYTTGTLGYLVRNQMAMNKTSTTDDRENHKVWRLMMAFRHEIAKTPIMPFQRMLGFIFRASSCQLRIENCASLHCAKDKSRDGVKNMNAQLYTFLSTLKAVAANIGEYNLPLGCSGSSGRE